MPEQELLNYIAKTRAQGFSKTEIHEALRAAGWTEQEIQEGFYSMAPDRASENTPGASLGQSSFFTTHTRLLLTILIALVALPLLIYGGLIAYQRLAARSPTNNASTVQGAVTNASPAKASQRDKLRLQNIESLQKALDKFEKQKRFYPSGLQELVSEKLIGKIPTDPKTGEPYLYTALGDPALHYSLSFVLEGNIGSLAAGLRSVSSEKNISAANIEKQDNLMQGAAVGNLTNDFKITNLSVTPFYPGENVTLKVDPGRIDLDSVFLITDTLRLADRKPPFEFTFSAPKKAGAYEAKVFGFDQKGNSYFQSTAFSVTAQN